MRIDYNQNRYLASAERVKDADGNIVYVGDYCEYVNKIGKVKKGRAKCVSDHDCHFAEYAFIDDEGERDFAEDCICVRVIDKNEKPNDEMMKTVVIDKLKVELSRHGFKVEEDVHGFLVNDKYIVAYEKKKWRVKGRNKWYWYKDVESLSKYFMPKY